MHGYCMCITAVLCSAWQNTSRKGGDEMAVKAKLQVRVLEETYTAIMRQADAEGVNPGTIIDRAIQEQRERRESDTRPAQG
jgi:hypothetical protein